MIKRGINFISYVAFAALLLAGVRSFAADSQTTLIQVHLRGTAVEDDPGGSDKPVKVTVTEADILGGSNTLLVARINLALTTGNATNAPDLAFNLEEWNDENGNGELDPEDTMSSEIFFVNGLVMLANGRFNATIATDSDDDESELLADHAVTLNVRGRAKIKDLNGDGKLWEIRDFTSEVTGGDMTVGLLLDGRLHSVGKAYLAFDEESDDSKPAHSKFSPSQLRHR